jgi:hypothetical protein
MLPAPGGIGARGARGADSGSAFAPSILTMLGDAAARRNNEMTRLPEAEELGSPPARGRP